MRKYVITGAGFGNKGAESMLYTVITELRRKDPDADITVLCLHGFDRVKEEDFDNITIFQENGKCRKILLSPFRFFLYRLKNMFYPIFRYKKNKYPLLYKCKNCDVILDISGYAISSQWGDMPDKRLLETIEFAYKNHKKIFLLPQSFGPFGFAKKEGDLINALSKVDMIFCREVDGYDLLCSYNLKNIVKSSDIVLESAKPYQGIYRNLKSKSIAFTEGEKRVLIIPNIRVFERVDIDNLYDNYNQAIMLLLQKGYKVYISYYDLSDVEICRKIKSFYADNDDVVFIDEYLNCIDFANLLDSFDLLISSRFHSIVHAYKKYIPCMVIGWAVKYAELTSKLKQENYMFDARKKIEAHEFLAKLEDLLKNRDIEKSKIKEAVLQIQKNSCFNLLWSYLDNE